MSRPLRIESPGAFYHVKSRGDRREPIYEDDKDREAFLDILHTETGTSEARLKSKKGWLSLRHAVPKPEAFCPLITLSNGAG